MTATTTGPPAPSSAAATGGRAPGERVVRAHLPKGKRSTTRWVGVLCVVMGAALAAIVAARALSGDGVVVAARVIPAGTVITGEDLVTGQLRGEGIVSVPAGQARSLLGQTAVGPIPAGALLAPDMLVQDPAPGPGQAGVGLNLKAGQVPPRLDPGRHVSVLLVSADSGGGGEQVPARTVLVDNAQVVAVQEDPGGTWLVTVSVPAGSAADVASAAAVGRVALVVLPVGA